MLVKLFDIQNSKVVPTEHCYTINSLKTIMDENFSNQSYIDSANKIYSIINQSVLMDTNKFYSYLNFQNKHILVKLYLI